MLVVWRNAVWFSYNGAGVCCVVLMFEYGCIVLLSFSGMIVFCVLFRYGDMLCVSTRDFLFSFISEVCGMWYALWFYWR